MPRFRFSITMLLAVIAIAGIGLAALRYASPIWAGIILTATAGIILTSILGAFLSRDRAPWLGFAVFSCGWVLMSWGGNMFDWVERDTPFSNSPFTRALDVLYPHVHHHPPTYEVNEEWSHISWALQKMTDLHVYGDEYFAFLSIGHALLCLLAGCVGMVVARRFPPRGPDIERSGAPSPISHPPAPTT